MVNLWTCEIDLNTGKISRYTFQHDDYPSYSSFEEAYENGCMFGSAGYATLDWSSASVYAESIVSQADADRLVLEKCQECLSQLQRAINQFAKPDSQ